MSQLISIQVTAPDKVVAEHIGRILVECRLVACAQIEGPIGSTYIWKDQLENDEEWRIVLKTEASMFPQIEQKILQEHPYEVPQIIASEMCMASKNYRDWILKQIG